MFFKSPKNITKIVKIEKKLDILQTILVWHGAGPTHCFIYIDSSISPLSRLSLALSCYIL